MDHFLYKNGALHAEDVPIADIAAAVGTPFYVYSSATLLRHFTVFDEALDGMDHLVCYAMKANSNLAVIKLLGQHGAGMDVVSGGEYRRARAAGVDGSKIVFSGVGKTREEMALALEGGIRQFNGAVRCCAQYGKNRTNHNPREPRCGRKDPRKNRNW